MTNPTETHVRRATETDIPGLVLLQRSVTSERLAWFADQAVSENSLRELFTAVRRYPDSIVFVAEQSGVIVGELDCVGLGGSTSEFVITVHRDHRQSGVGSGLLRALLNWAEGQLELGRLQAKVMEPNLASVRLLKRFGFSELPTWPETVTIRGITMRVFFYHRDLDRS